MDRGEFPSLSTFPGNIVPDIPGDEPVYLTGNEIREELAANGLGTKQATMGAAIALVEAPGPASVDGKATSNFSLINGEWGPVWGPRFGGFQIQALTTQHDSGLVRDGAMLLDPIFNITAAVALKRLYGWGYWSSYGTTLMKNFFNQLMLETGKPPEPVTHVVMPGEVNLRFVGKLPDMPA